MFVDAAQALIYDKVPPPSHDQLVRAARAGIRECNRWGVTAVAEPGSNDNTLAAHVELIERDDYPIRNYVMLSDDRSLIDQHLARGIVDGAYDGRLWTRAVKMFADGALGSGGAALLEPYSDDPNNRGLIVTPEAHVMEVTEKAMRAGFQVCVHAIGDRANRMVLDAYETALRRVGLERRPAPSDRARASRRSRRHPAVRAARRHPVHADDAPDQRHGAGRNRASGRSACWARTRGARCSIRA